jgi:hypothetical protein
MMVVPAVNVNHVFYSLPLPFHPGMHFGFYILHKHCETVKRLKAGFRKLQPHAEI